MNAIEITNLSKQYKLGSIGYGSLYREIQSFFSKIKGKEDPNKKIDFNTNNEKKDYILALKNINLEINHGEIIGLIGANGSGKSTLLKVLSRITYPSSGSVKIFGKTASLLEVGTGFHPELTGRENIFLNGSIYGMSKKEINNKLNDIVEFSGVGQYLDTPVKRYSSGMHIKLGFSVLAHLTQNILLVDEVLAVGDAKFRKKALDKMGELCKKNKRTVLFVSHNMKLIQNLCTRGVLLDNGQVNFTGDVQTTINKYNETLQSKEINELSGITSREFRRGSGKARFSYVKIKDHKNEEKLIFENHEKVLIKIRCKVFSDLKNLIIKFAFKSADNDEFITSYTKFFLSKVPVTKNQSFEGTIEIDINNFMPNILKPILYLGEDDFQEQHDLINGLLPSISIINSNESELKGIFKGKLRYIPDNHE